MIRRKVLASILLAVTLVASAPFAFAGGTDYAANHTLDHLYGKGARNFTSPPALYAGLFTVAPGPAGTGGTEVTGTNYARAVVTFAAATNRAAANSTLVSFGNAGSSWGTPVSVVIVDAATAGNILEVATITVPVNIPSGSDVNIPIGALVISRP